MPNPVKPEAGALRGSRLALLCAVGALAALPPRPDVDVSVPPGSPLDWGRSFPAITPGAGGLFPTTRADEPGPEQAEQRTEVRAESPTLDVRFSSSYDLTRILTLDIVTELGWIETRPSELPRTGRSTLLPELPEPGDPAYWVGLSPLLRLLLHPSTAPRTEVEAHLIEIGTPVLPVLDSAQSQGYLRRTCQLVRAAVTPVRDRAPAPRPGEGPVDAMLSRFVFDELRREHPYDPIGSFGERLFLFGDELEPYVAAYATDGNAYMRRSAVAALGRYRTRSAMQALMTIAATTTDPVALARSCSALGRGRIRVDLAPLIDRLEKAREPVERTVLVGTLGRLEASAALPAILSLGADALGRGDSDLLVTVMTALARIRPGKHRREVLELAVRVEQAARSRPAELQPPGGLSPVKADRPDRREQRATVLHQLSVVVQVLLDPMDPGLQQRALALLTDLELTNPLNPGGLWMNSISMSRIEAPVQFVFVDLLERMDIAGSEPLVGAAEDPGLSISLRGYALAHLPWAERRPRSAAILEDGGATELRIRALELADRDDHPELERLARRELERCAGLPSGLGSPADRFLGLTALRALGARGRLTAEDVLPLLHHAKSPKVAFGDFPERMRKRVEEAVLYSTRGASRSGNGGRAADLVDDVLREGIHPELAERPRRSVIDELAGILNSARAHRKDVVFLELGVKQILELLLGYPQPRWSRVSAEFSPQVQLEEEILLALGRTGEPEAVAALQGFLQNRKNRLRGVACLALGMAGDPSSADHLAPYLLDQDGFARWCAYRSLAHLADLELPIDWMYAPKDTRYASAQEAWKQLMKPR